MPNTTPIYGFRYPVGTEPPSGPLGVEHLAEDVEARLAANAALVGGEWRAAANQTLNNASGANLLTLTGTIQPANGITWNGSNQATILTPGVYAMSVTAGTPSFVSGANFSAAVGKGAAAPISGTSWLVAPSFSQNQTDSGVSGTRYLDAGTIVRPYVYNNGSPITMTTAKPAEFAIWRVR